MSTGATDPQNRIPGTNPRSATHFFDGGEGSPPVALRRNLLLSCWLCPQRPTGEQAEGVDTGAFGSPTPAAAPARHRQPHPCPRGIGHTHAPFQSPHTHAPFQSPRGKPSACAADIPPTSTQDSKPSHRHRLAVRSGRRGGRWNGSANPTFQKMTAPRPALPPTAACQQVFKHSGCT